MKIAIPVEAGKVANHLGHCDYFLFADVVDGRVVQQANVPNPGHGPGGPPPMFLAQQGVTQILAWGMPPHAQGMFSRFGIAFVLGATGDPQKVLTDYLAGTLELTQEGLDAGGGCNHDH